MKNYDIHPDFLRYANMKPPMNAILLPAINYFLTRQFYRTPVPEGLAEEHHTIEGYREAPVRLTVLSPEAASEPRGENHLLPALLYIHGGAFALQAAPYLKRLASRYALETPCKVILVDYHLLPKATFPTGLEDCFAAYAWVRANSGLLHIDPDRIAISGDSAGGALAIGVCLLAQERSIPLPCFQMLIYPVTDERQKTQSIREFSDTPLWNSKLNTKMWRMYLKEPLSLDKALASPAEAPSLEGMPPAYVEVSEYDCLRDEGIAFADALQASGTQVKLNQTTRTVHGFEIAENNEIVESNANIRIGRLREAFGTS